tara:strand:+ start:61 stop:474 length:414 start_codon:yes stop_codon:yes gene_type:complete
MSHPVNDQILDNLSVEVGTMTISQFITVHTDTANAICNSPYNGHLTQIRERSTAVARIASRVIHNNNQFDNLTGFPEAKASFYVATWDDVVDHLDSKWNELTVKQDWKNRSILGKDIDIMREAFADIVDYKFDQLCD